MNLNVRQRKVVEATEDKILCLAAAGSGKTRCLTERVRYLINNGCAPKEIACITFTSMSADEMKKRLGNIAIGAFIGTIHSLANNTCIANGISTEKYIADMEFDMILRKALTIPKSRYPKFTHLLIDEFQDTGQLEYSFIERIPTKNFFAVADERQCQPAGTKILTIKNEEKNIEDIQIGDAIVGYSTDKGNFHNPLGNGSRGTKVLDIAHREYNDYLYTVKTENNCISSYTNNHITYIQMKELEKPLYCLYLMCDEKERYRIGKTTLYNKDKEGKVYNGLRQRMLAEKCSKGWVLKVSFDEKEILKDEILYSLKFGIPQLILNIKRTRKYNSEQEENYMEIADMLYEEFNTKENAKRCLDFFGKNIDYPYTEINDKRHFTKNSLVTIYACNLIPEIMYLAEFDQDTLKKKLVSFELKKEKVNTIVYSLETGSHNYVADGILTHNCIYGFKGASDIYVRNLYHDAFCKIYYLNQNYRCAPNIISYADSLIASMDKLSPKTEAIKTKNGYVSEHSTFADALDELEWSQDWGNWFVLARTNNELATAMTKLEERDIPYISFKKGDLDLIEMEALLKDNRVKVLTIHTCISGDTIVPTSSGLMTIEQIVKEHDKTNLIYNGEYYDKVRDFIDNGIELTYKLTTKTGNQLRLTENHDIIVLTEEGLKKKKIKDLNEKENVLLRKNIKNYKYTDILMTPIKEEELYGNEIIYSTPEILDENLAELIGMITADGTHNSRSIHYLKHHKECVERFAELIKICFNKNILVNKCTDRDAWFTECNSTYIVKYLYKNFDGIKNNNKKISLKILQSSQSVQCAFLKGLFEDGTVSLKKGKVDNITLTFKNSDMRPQLQTMLLSLGIDASFTCRKYSEKIINYCYIYSQGINIYKEKIGFISKLKKDRLNDFCPKYDRKNKSSVLKNIMIKHKKQLYIKGQSLFWANLNKNQGLTSGAFYKYYNLLNDKQKEMDCIVFIKDIFDNYLIEDISLIEKYKEEKTYCLTMEHENQFIQNGFLMGNSKGLENKNVIVTGARLYNEEERKIAYVAATRAEQSLYWCPSICRRGKIGRPDNRDDADAGRVFEKAAKNMISFG